VPLDPRNDEADSENGDGRTDQNRLLADPLLDDGNRDAAGNEADTGNDKAESEGLNGNSSTRKEDLRL